MRPEPRERRQTQRFEPPQTVASVRPRPAAISEPAFRLVQPIIATYPEQSVHTLLVELKLYLRLSPSNARSVKLSLCHRDICIHYAWHSEMLHVQRQVQPCSAERLERLEFFAGKIAGLLQKLQILEKRVRETLQDENYPLMKVPEIPEWNGVPPGELEEDEYELFGHQEIEMPTVLDRIPVSTVRDEYTDEEKRRSGELFKAEEIRRSGLFLLEQMED